MVVQGLFLSYTLGCADGELKGSSAPAVAAPRLGDTVEILPGSGVAGVVHQAAHNNLDVIVHDNRIFLAFRTAPSHFASTETMLYVLSRADGDDAAPWELEHSVGMETDLREPRFLAFDSRLFLYFAVLGQDAGDFEPQGMMVSERGAAGWTEPEPNYDQGFIPWRARVVDSGPHEGEPWMIGYIGGENIYDADAEPVVIHLITTTDGRSWAPVAADAEVDVGGGSETDWVVLDDGDLLAVQRNEAGEEGHWGSKICRVPATDLGDWSCVNDPLKYDSPLMFRAGGRSWLVGRRNVTETGAYDLGMDELSTLDQANTYALSYWNAPKRCALWEVDAEALSVAWVLDLPSRGDTCFPSMVRAPNGAWHIYNYSSPLDDPAMDSDDPSWIEGQTGETRIYRSEIWF